MRQFFCALIVIITLYSCNKEIESDYPLVFTGDVVNIKDTTATFTAKISNTGAFTVLESGFVWGVHSQDDNGIQVKKSGGEAGSYSLQTNEKLLPGLTYYVRAYVRAESAITYGREVSFSIPQAGPADTGNWSVIYDNHPPVGFSVAVTCGYTLDNITYLVFWNGTVYQYDHQANTFGFVVYNPDILGASLSVVYNSTAYIFVKNAFHKFDPQTNTFEKLKVLDESINLVGTSGFLIGDYIYIGLGVNHYTEYIKDFWKYSITEDTWQQTASFPGDFRQYGISFSLNNSGYTGGGLNLLRNNLNPHFNDLWQYIPESDQWIQRENIPLEIKSMGILGNNTTDFGYCYYQNSFIEYNPDFDFWAGMASIHVEAPFFPDFLFAVDKRIYLVMVTENDDDYYFKLLVYEK